MLKKILTAVKAEASFKPPSAIEMPLFPLGTVLFPGGVLPLKIFEQRYMDMAKACLKNHATFGVCLIREGSEVGQPAVPETIGTVARIDDWDMRQLGVLQVRVIGLERFRILSSAVHSSGLVVGSVETIAADNSVESEEFAACRDFLAKVLAQIGTERFSGEPQLDDASWVSFRITEILPINQTIKQKMLELTDAGMRLDILHRVLKEQRLVG